MYSPYDKKECITLHYNYNPACMETRGDRIERFSDEWITAHIGSNGVIEIVEHRSAGDGDRWFFDIVKEDHTVERVFNPHIAFYKIIE